MNESPISWMLLFAAFLAAGLVKGITMWRGQKIRNGISPRCFRACFLAFLLLLGLELALRSLIKNFTVFKETP